MNNENVTVIETQQIADLLWPKVSEVVQRQVADALKAQQVGFATGDPAQTSGYKSFGHFLRAVAGVEAKAQLVKDGPSGGYLVPTEFARRIYEVAAEQDVFARLGANGPLEIPMTSGRLDVPALDVTVAADGMATAMAAGVRLFVSDEETTASETQAVFSKITLQAYPLRAYTKISNSLLANEAVGAEQVLTRLFATAYAAAKSWMFIRGTGVGMAHGVLNHPATIFVARETQVGATLVAMLSRLLPSSSNRAVWFAHPYLRSTLAAAQIGSAPVMSWGDVRTGLPDTLLGRPIYWVEHMPANYTDRGALLLADWTHYYFGNRQSLTVSMSEHVHFLQAMSTWLVTAEFDGQPGIAGPINLSGGGQVSPFVSLVAA